MYKNAPFVSVVVKASNISKFLKEVNTLKEITQIYTDELKRPFYTVTNDPLFYDQWYIDFLGVSYLWDNIKNIIINEYTKKNLKIPLIGAMIEIPSLIFSLDELQKVADFFSIGTNDLFQYTFAVDRTNPFVSSLYKPTNDTFLKIMEYIYKKLSKSGKHIDICGEVATDRTTLEKLIAIGYQNFSVNPYVLKKLKSYF